MVSGKRSRFPLLHRASSSVGPGGLFPCSEVPGEGRIPFPTLTMKALRHVSCLEDTDSEENYTDLGPIHIMRRGSVTLPSEWSLFTLATLESASLSSDEHVLSQGIYVIGIGWYRSSVGVH